MIEQYWLIVEEIREKKISLHASLIVNNNQRNIRASQFLLSKPFYEDDDELWCCAMGSAWRRELIESLWSTMLHWSSSTIIKAIDYQNTIYQPNPANNYVPSIMEFDKWKSTFSQFSPITKQCAFNGKRLIDACNMNYNNIE